MKKTIIATAFLACAGAALADEAASAAEGGVRFHPLHMKSYVDMGQIVKGHSNELAGDLLYKGNAGDIQNYFLSNIGIGLVSQADVGESSEINIGVGGLFWYPFPNLSAASRLIKFGPGIAEASFRHNLSDNLWFKLGYFPYKYDPEAQNLGEYLFRSECYPGIVKTGGWNWLEKANRKTLGAQLRWETFGGAWSHDLLLFSDFEESPIWDFSPAYVSTLRAGSVFEIGAGVSLHRWLPVKPSSEKPDALASTYVEIDNFPALPQIMDTVWKDAEADKTPDNIDHLTRAQDAFAGGTLKEMESHIIDLKDTNGAQVAPRKIDSLGRAYYLVNGQPVYPRVRKRLTFQGVKLMGRASLDFKPLFGLQTAMGPDDFKLYFEATVLGLQNQPYYYEKIADRIPIMMGFNVPTFHLLDLFAVQFEYYRNPYPDSKENSYNHTWPIWTLTPGGDNPAAYHEARDAGVYAEDDWKWSVNATRTLTRGLEVQTQVAKDHFRLRDDFTRPGVAPVTTRKGQWYYLVRLQWGI